MPEPQSQSFEFALSRIVMLGTGQTAPRLSSAPLLSSAQAGWKGIRLEHHRMQPRQELAGTVEGYQVCLHLTGPVPMIWRIDGHASFQTLQPRELCTASHGEFRSVSWQRSFETMFVSISPKIMSELSSESSGAQPVELVKHRGIHDTQIETILRLLRADVAGGTPAGPLFGEQLGTALALYLFRRFAVHQRKTKHYRSGLTGNTLRRLFEYIDGHLDQPISLDDLARVAGISRFYFSALFRNSTGESPCRHVISRRIHHAKRLLANDSITIEEISRITGFSSQSHLASLFRCRVGVTPSKYRSSLR